MTRNQDPLSIKRIQLARETLREAAHVEGFHGAIGSEDCRGVLIEAKRNLTALVQVLYGVDAWEKVLNKDL